MLMFGKVRGRCSGRSENHGGCSVQTSVLLKLRWMHMCMPCQECSALCAM
jgi:hypothetical protein